MRVPTQCTYVDGLPTDIGEWAVSAQVIRRNGEWESSYQVPIFILPACMGIDAMHKATDVLSASGNPAELYLVICKAL